MINITLLGTGILTNTHRFQSGVLVEVGENKLLFDCDRGTVHQLYQAGIDIGRINPVFHHPPSFSKKKALDNLQGLLSRVDVKIKCNVGAT